MKKKFVLGISCLFLLSTFESKSDFIDEYLNKLWMFFLIEMSSTFVHECGHAAVIAGYKGKSAIYMGKIGRNHTHSDTDRRVNILGPDPSCGHTHIFKYNNINTSKKMGQISAAGPIYGMAWNLLIYAMLGFYESRFTPALYNSLRMFTLVGAFKEFCYGAIPLSPFGDTKNIYTRFKLMSEKRYESAAAKNLKSLENLSGFCILVALIKKTIRTIGTQGMVDSMDEFKKNNATLCLLYKVISLYAIEYGVVGNILGILKELDEHKNKKKEKLPEPSPMNWLAGQLVAPLII